MTLYYTKLKFVEMVDDENGLLAAHCLEVCSLFMRCDMLGKNVFFMSDKMWSDSA